MEKKGFIGIIITILMIMSIGIYSFANSNITNASLLERYNPEEEAFWNVVPEDVLIYAIYDSLIYNETGFNTQDIALLRNEILAIDDQGIDSDTYPDLLMNSEFLIGNENFGVTIGQYLDLSFLNLIEPIATLIQGGVMDNNSNIILPSLNSLHFVNSEVLNILDAFQTFFASENADGNLPLYSFNTGVENTNLSSTFLMSMLDPLNSVTYQYMPLERNESIGLRFIQNNITGSAFIATTNLDESTTAGSFGYDFLINDTLSNFTTVSGDFYGDNPFTEMNGIIFTIVGEEIFIYNGEFIWFDNGIIQNWVPNPFAQSYSKIADIELNTWNNIEVIYPNNYTEKVKFHINDQIIDVNYSVSDPIYDFKTSTTMMGATPFNSNPTTFYLDNLDFDQINVTEAVPSAMDGSNLRILLENIDLFNLLKVFSLYSMLFFPKTINFDVFYDTLLNLIQYVDEMLLKNFNLGFSLVDIFNAMAINNDRQFKITYNSTMAKDTWDSISENIPMLPNVDFEFIEGDTDWVIEMSWDKQINVMNCSRIICNYLDIGVVREIGMKLIATRSPKGFADGYTYFVGDWYDSNITKPVLRPYVRTTSQLNVDIYPSTIPKEYDIFNPDILTQAFMSEFNYNPVLDQIVRDNLPLIALGLAGIVAGSSLFTILSSSLVDLIKKRKLGKISPEPLL
jgi:hypothetical protein